MSEKIRGGSLCINTNGNMSEVVINGVPQDILFNWTVLTEQISDDLQIPIHILAMLLPKWAERFKDVEMKEAVSIDLSKLKYKKGGQT